MSETKVAAPIPTEQKVPVEKVVPVVGAVVEAAPVTGAVVEAAQATTAKPKARWGVSTDTQGAGNDPIKPTKKNPIPLVKLIAVTVGNKQYKADSNHFFKDIIVPCLMFQFEEVGNPSGKNGVYFHSFDCIPPVYGTFNEKTRNDTLKTMFNYVKHFSDELFDHVYGPKDGAFLELDDAEQDQATIIAAFTATFTKLAADFQHCLNTKVWSKLLLYYAPGKKVNNGNFGFSRYIPTGGTIERAVEGRPTTLEILIAKGESIVPKEEAAAIPGQMPMPGANTEQDNNMEDVALPEGL